MSLENTQSEINEIKRKIKDLETERQAVIDKIKILEQLLDEELDNEKRNRVEARILTETGRIAPLDTRLAAYEQERRGLMPSLQTGQVTTAGLGQDFLQAVEKVMEKPLKAFGELLFEQNSLLMKEIRTIVRPESVNFSDLTENQANYKKLKDILNIQFMDVDTKTMLPYEFVNRNKEFKFNKFCWGNRTEPQGSPDAIDFLNDTLKRVKVYDDTNKTRDLFNNNGFKFIDARSHLIGFSLEGTRYHGMVDCFITPFQKSDVDSSKQLRAFCEWKAYKDPNSVNLSTCRPQFFAELIAANYVSKHPVLGILTNLVNRFILAYIQENDNTNDNESHSASSSNKLDVSKKPKMMKSFIIQIFDTDSVKKQMDKPLEFACLFISYWLSQCSTNPLFADLKNQVNIRSSRNQDSYNDPYNLDFFVPLYNSNDHLREFFDAPDKNSDEGLGMFLEQMNSVCETAQERAEFIRNRLLSEFSSLYVQESLPTGFDYNSMYA